MTMEQLSVLQLLWLFAAYFTISILLPHYTFGKVISFRNRYERFLVYTTIGNFYVINLVLMLEICHLSYPITLIGITVVLSTAVKIRLEKIPVKARFKKVVSTLRKLFEGELGTKTFVYRETGKVLRKRRSVFRHFFDVYIRHFPEVLMVVLLFAILFYEYGYNAVTQFGYKASDLIVHNYWVNALNVNDVFVDGVYPFGFHCTVYFLHAVFGMDSFVVLRLIAFVQNVWLNLTCVCTLILVLRNKYVAYMGVFLYILCGYFLFGTYSRFYASLPQEFGMIFIYPCFYFLVDYFRQQRREAHGSVSGKPRTALIMFALSFALTLEVHFYGTMIAGLMCMGIACGFLFLFIRGRYFKRIMTTGILSVLIAVFPMALAFSLGTPLQGSLGWGLSVITGQKAGDETTEVVTETDPGVSTVTDPGGPGQTGTTSTVSGRTETEKEKHEFDLKGTLYRIMDRFRGFIVEVGVTTNYNIIKFDGENDIYYMMAIFPALVLLGLFFFLPIYRNQCYGAMVISTGMYMIITCFLIISPGFWGLPFLMDLNRGGVYYTYSVPLFTSVFVDAIIYLLMPFKNRILPNLASFAAIAGVILFLYENDRIKEPNEFTGMEMNDAIKCVTNIIYTDEDFQWTIVSANDENQMCYDHGFHYEIIDFLRRMEGNGSGGKITIPTPVVFFFIEKVPIDYFEHYDGSGQTISEAGARNPLPWANGIGAYMGRNRWIIMSRLYEWAEKFRALYPNEVNIYLETDDFICYRVEQNPYRLFNFAIDYYYNLIDYYSENQESDF